MLAEHGQMMALNKEYPVDPSFSIIDFNDKKYFSRWSFSFIPLISIKHTNKRQVNAKIFNDEQMKYTSSEY